MSSPGREFWKKAADLSLPQVRDPEPPPVIALAHYPPTVLFGITGFVRNRTVARLRWG